MQLRLRPGCTRRFTCLARTLLAGSIWTYRSGHGSLLINHLQRSSAEPSATAARFGHAPPSRMPRPTSRSRRSPS